MTAAYAFPSDEYDEIIRLLLVDNHQVTRAGLRLLLEMHERFTVVGEASDCEMAEHLIHTAHPHIVLIELQWETGGTELNCLERLLQSEAALILLTATSDEELHRQALQRGVRGVVLKQQTHEVLFEAIEHVATGGTWLPPHVAAPVSGRAAGNPSLQKTAATPGLEAPQEHSDESAVMDHAALLCRITRHDEHEHSAPNDDARREMGWYATTHYLHEVSAAMLRHRQRIAKLSPRERQVIQLIGVGLKNRQIAQRMFLSEATVRNHLTSIFHKLEVKDRLELVIYAFHHGLVNTGATASGATASGATPSGETS